MDQPANGQVKLTPEIEQEVKAWETMLANLERLGDGRKETKAILRDIKFTINHVRRGTMIIALDRFHVYRDRIMNELSGVGILI